MNVFLKEQNGVKMVKICTKCKEEKDVSEFSKDKYTKDGLFYWCKKCVIKKTKNYRERIKNDSNREIIYSGLKICPECKVEKDVSEFVKDKNTKYGLYWCCKQCMNQYSKQYYKENKKEINQNKKQYIKEKYHNDPIFRLRKNVSCLIYVYLKRFNSSKKDSCLKHLDYTIQQLYDHLEKQFDSNMSWSNYGSYWDIDHIIPQSKLPYDSMEHPNFKKCWALSNLRPLEHMENVRKGNKLIY